jgi:putative component of membrane protein insertase Oxa1/YidC/SpoIIIJ protein YidD
VQFLMRVAGWITQVVGAIAAHVAIWVIRTLRAISARMDPSGCSCPDSECCWDYTVRVVRSHGITEGLEMALQKVRNCGNELQGVRQDVQERAGLEPAPSSDRS